MKFSESSHIGFPPCTAWTPPFRYYPRKTSVVNFLCRQEHVLRTGEPHELTAAFIVQRRRLDYRLHKNRRQVIVSAGRIAGQGEEAMAGLLDGIRVIDFGRFIAGPYAAMMLADFARDVIRVDRDGGEDRRVGPLTASGEGGLFLNLNRNKRGITLDPGHPNASAIIDRLVRSADIVVVNLPLDVMKKLRLDYNSLRPIKDDVILVMASTFGPDGPYRDRVGFDGVAQAMSGAMGLSGFPEAPVRSVVPWADFGTRCTPRSEPWPRLHRAKPAAARSSTCRCLPPA